MRKSDGKAPSNPDNHRMHTMVGLLGIAIIINVLGFSIIFPLVPYYVREALGPATSPYDPRIGTIGGWLTAVYALMQFFFAPIWGRLSDRIGRKPILIGSLIGDAIFYTMFGLSHTLPQLFAARILAGIFSSASLSVAQAYAADVSTPENRAAAMGIIGASFGVGFILGPAIGGPLGMHNLALPLFVSAGLALINMLYIARYVPESRPRGQETGQATSGPPAGLGSRLSLMTQALSGPIGFMYLLTFAVTFAFANLEGTFTTYLMQHFGYTSRSSVGIQGGVFAYIGVIIVLIQGGAIRPLVKKYGEASLVLAGVGLMALGFLLFPFPHVLWLLMIGPMLPISAGNGLNSPAIRAIISRKTSADAQGANLGLSASFDSLARATGPAAGGWLYGHYGQAAPYWCAGIVMTLSFLFAVLKKNEMTLDKQPEPLATADSHEAVTH